MNVIFRLAIATLVASAFVAPTSYAFDAAAERAERDRIKSERDQAEAAYRTRELECRQRFVVTPCLDQARRDRRQTMDRLRQQQEVLDEAQRKQRAAQRVGEIQTKVSGDEARQREAEARERRKEKQRVEAAASASAWRSRAKPSSGWEAPSEWNPRKGAGVGFGWSCSRPGNDERRRAVLLPKTVISNQESVISGRVPSTGHFAPH